MRKHGPLFLIALSALGYAGCRNDRDREPLRQLLLDLKQVLTEDYREELKAYPKEQLGLRTVARRYRRDVDVVDAFLNKEKALSEMGRAAAEALRDAYQKRAEYFEDMVRDGRFQRTQADKDAAAKLDDEVRKRLGDIDRIVDEK
jgi:hypothetical protein